MKTTFIALVAVASNFVAPLVTMAAQAKPTPQAERALPVPVESGHISANGINYYYAIYGRGEPLLMLHGGLGSIAWVSSCASPMTGLGR
jgi:hypothetical protein